MSHMQPYGHGVAYSQLPDPYYAGLQLHGMEGTLHGMEGTSCMPDTDPQQDKEKEKQEKQLSEKERIKQAEFKTATFDTYSICAALLSGFSCSASYIPVHKIESADTEVQKWAAYLQQWLVRLCTASGIYAMIVFTFCAMYARTALSRPTYGLQIYEHFSAGTAQIRRYAFYTMYYTALMYSSSLILSCLYTFHNAVSWMAGCSILVLIFFTMSHSNSLMDAAHIVFMSDEKLQEVIAMEEEEKQEQEARKQQEAMAVSEKSARTVSRETKKRIPGLKHALAQVV